MNRTLLHRDLLALLALLGAALVLHVRVLGLSFLSDDLSILYRIGVLDQVDVGSFFRPLPDWTHWLNYQLAGPRPWAFRVVNVLLLGFNGWLLARTIGRLSVHLPFPAEAMWWAAVLFVVYPFHQEPQVWIVGRSTAMASTSVLLALYVALGKGPLGARVGGVALWTFIGTLCYEYALLIPALLTLLWSALGRREHARWWPVVGASTVMVMINLLLRSWTSGAVANAYGSGFFQRPLSDYIEAAAKVTGRLFLPPHPDVQVQVWRMAVLGVVLITAVLLAWRRMQAPSKQAVMVLMAMAAVSASVAVLGGVNTRTSESDRFLYLPAAFLCAAVAVGVTSSVRYRVPMLIGLVTLCIGAQWRGHSNWVTASNTMDRIIAATPTAERGTRLFVAGLPGDHRGAYILRHGYQEALLLAGRDTTGLVWVDSVRFDLQEERTAIAFMHGSPQDTIHLREGDRAIAWNGTTFLDGRPNAR
jgi:hypothetical protein